MEREEVKMSPEQRGFSPGLAFTEAAGALIIGNGIVFREPQAIFMGATVASIPFVVEVIVWFKGRNQNGQKPDRDSGNN